MAHARCVAAQHHPPARVAEPPCRWRLLPALCALTFKMAEGTWVPSTRASHLNSITRFQCFCIMQHVPQKERFPILEEVLCAFAVHRAGHVAGATVCNDIAGLHVYHTTHRLPWPTLICLKYIITGVKCACPNSSCKALQLPASLKMLHGIYNATNWASDLSVAVFACVLVAFWGQFQLGKLLLDSIHAFNPALHPTRLAWSGMGNPSIRLPWTKTTRNTGTIVVLPPQPRSQTCLVTAMAAMFQTCCVPANALLFGHTIDGVF
jgi:hypothetical protein